MACRSPECRRSCRECDLWGLLRRDQRQAPVAAETQRRVMRLRISPTTGFGFDLMRWPCGNENLPCRISGHDTHWSMKWVSNFFIATLPTCYATGPKGAERSQEPSRSDAAGDLPHPMRPAKTRRLHVHSDIDLHPLERLRYAESCNWCLRNGLSRHDRLQPVFEPQYPLLRSTSVRR